MRCPVACQESLGAQGARHGVAHPGLWGHVPRLPGCVARGHSAAMGTWGRAAEPLAGPQWRSPLAQALGLLGSTTCLSLAPCPLSTRAPPLCLPGPRASLTRFPRVLRVLARAGGCWTSYLPLALHHSLFTWAPPLCLPRAGGCCPRGRPGLRAACGCGGGCGAVVRPAGAVGGGEAQHNTRQVGHTWGGGKKLLKGGGKGG